MFIDINNIEPDGLSFDESLELGQLDASATDPVEVVDCKLRGSAAPGDRGVELWARLEARVILMCSRCLGPSEARVEADLHRILVAHEPEAGGAGAVEMRDEDVALLHAEDGKVDLATVAAEQIYLDLPLKPVCRPDCQGLCATCGVNRNLLECDCPDETADLRLAPLEELKRRLRNP